MFSERTKEGAAQATAREFQEETRNVEATMRIQQQEQMFTGKKLTKMERRPNHVHVQQDFAFFHRSQNETYVKKTLKRKRNVVALEMYTADWR